MFALSLVMVCVILAAFGQIAMKHGMNDVGKEGMSKLTSIKGLFNIFTNKYVFVGCLLYAFGLVLWLFALSMLDVSLMYPLISIGYVLTAVLAFVFLKENITTLRWAGIALVVIGSIMIIRTG